MVKQLLSRLLRRQSPQQVRFAKDMDLEFRDIYHASKDYSMTSLDRSYALYKAVEYIEGANIPGDFVECGVWKGGSITIMANTLSMLNAHDRTLYLYDTFEGMPEPGDNDVKIRTGVPGKETWQQKQEEGGWAYAGLEEVKQHVYSTNYPHEKFVFVEGKVEETIPKISPSSIALLRLDTDWFASTYHELVHLFPLVSEGGVIIIDDYGSWSGSKEATDKYLLENNVTMYLHRVDAGRIGIKQTLSR